MEEFYESRPKPYYRAVYANKPKLMSGLIKNEIYVGFNLKYENYLAMVIFLIAFTSAL